jgi:DNA polymerase-1
MQGTAADIIKKAMINVHGWLASANLNTRMTMQVHDELVLEVPEENIQEVASGVEKLMSSAVELCIPLVVEAGVGDNWDEAH